MLFTRTVYFYRGKNVCCFLGHYTSSVGFFVVYTDVIFLPRGISPLRSDYRPHSGRNDIIKPVVHNVISSVGVAEVEKSHTIETETVVYVMRRDEGVPPYRRLRRESDTMSFRALVKKFPCGKNGTLHIRASQLARGGSPPNEANRVANEGNRIPIINVTSFSPHPSCLRDSILYNSLYRAEPDGRGRARE